MCSPEQVVHITRPVGKPFLVSETEDTPVTLRMGSACLLLSRFDQTSARQICMPNKMALRRLHKSPIVAGAPLSSSSAMPQMDAPTATQIDRLIRAPPSNAARTGVATTVGTNNSTRGCDAALMPRLALLKPSVTGDPAAPPVMPLRKAPREASPVRSPILCDK